jgi:hypothetical protein
VNNQTSHPPVADTIVLLDLLGDTERRQEAKWSHVVHLLDRGWLFPLEFASDYSFPFEHLHGQVAAQIHFC